MDVNPPTARGQVAKADGRRAFAVNCSTVGSNMRCPEPDSGKYPAEVQRHVGHALPKVLSELRYIFCGTRSRRLLGGRSPKMDNRQPPTPVLHTQAVYANACLCPAYYSNGNRESSARNSIHQPIFFPGLVQRIVSGWGDNHAYWIPYC